jgi:signal transduction histidine kinase
VNRPSQNPIGSTGESAAEELRRLKFRHTLSARLAQAGDAEAVLRLGIRDALDFFGAAAGCVAVFERGPAPARVLVRIPKSVGWDLDVLSRYAARERVAAAPDTMMTRLKRRGRDWGVLALRRGEGEFDWRDRDALVEIGAVLNESLARVDRDRSTEVRERINRKIMERLRPKDLFYQILDGLRSLTGYEHSSALLIASDGDGAFTVVAEQIAWRKGGSNRIGLSLPLDDGVRATLRAGEVQGFIRERDGWRDWKGSGSVALASLLDYNVDDPTSPREASMLCAPLASRDGVLALVKVAGMNPDELGAHEAELLRTLLPQASVAVQNLQRTTALEERVVEADRKHAMADLARSVAHDLNNAMGGVLPVLQQMHQDVAAGLLDQVQFAKDIQQIERSVQWSRRILGGMLAFAKSSLRAGGQAEVTPAVQRALDLLKSGMESRGIELGVEVSPNLPRPRIAQVELEQILFNLLSNARDATPRGGRVDLVVLQSEGSIELTVADTGCGIPPEHLSKIQEPFFTTKPGGNGLGLSICRSIAWNAGGVLQFESHVGKGTRARVVLPIAEASP